MGTKMAVLLANIFMARVETEISNQSAFNWKRYIDRMFSHWTLNREEIMQFIDQAQKQHPRIKFTAEISDRETNDGSDWKTFSVLLKPSQRHAIGWR